MTAGECETADAGRDRGMRAIEESFPIVEINRLAVPERNSFKPIYRMHKWFARRASCVFRAILLGCLKPAGTNIMDEFYLDHSDDPDTKDKVILDPFMGGGTTVVEALRLGCRVIGVDLNPVAWFIVRTEAEPIDLEELKAAFARLATRTVEWSGKSVRDTLLAQYKTRCPCCHGEADTVYTFWVKSAICHNEACPGRAQGRGPAVPLFSDYVVAQKKPAIRFWRDVRCPKCKQRFDWETEAAALIAESSLMCNDRLTSGGEPRGKVRWAFSEKDSVQCPWCNEIVNPLPERPPKRERKRVALNVLLCPHCETIWQWRGQLPDQVQCPACRHQYDPHKGNVPEKGRFVCPSCGTKQAVIESTRRIPAEEVLPFRQYAIEGHCSSCSQDREAERESEADLFPLSPPASPKAFPGEPHHDCLVRSMDGLFFKRIDALDQRQFSEACQVWQRVKSDLPYPHQAIPWGEKTKTHLIGHHFMYWHQIFNPRQLLCLASLCRAIQDEADERCRDMLALTLSESTARNNMFCYYWNDRNTIMSNFDRHDFAPKNTPAENSVWGFKQFRGTFCNLFERTLEGKEFARRTYDNKRVAGRNVVVYRDEVVSGEVRDLHCGDSRDVVRSVEETATLVVTDPPYVGNVNYAELSDFYYVWLRLMLSGRYPEFAPEVTSKQGEIIENKTRGLTLEDFEVGLVEVWSQCRRVLSSGGLLVFTFHHAEGSAWEVVLESVLSSGFEMVAVYPVHGEKESSLNLMDKEGAISYDLIHVCREREAGSVREARSWAGIRQEIRRRAREEIRAIEAGRYGNEPLSPADVNIILIGKCLELYSRHYGSVLGYDDQPVELHDALKDIRSMVDDLVAREHPLPSALEDVDAESRIYLLTLCAFAREIKSDDLNKLTRGILEPDDLLKSGLIIKGRAKRGRTYEVRLPAERYDGLRERFGVEQLTQTDLFGEDLQPRAWQRTLFIDRVHFLMGLVEAGENIRPWLEHFRGQTPPIRAACEHLKQRQPRFVATCDKILRFLEVDPLFRGKA